MAAKQQMCELCHQNIKSILKLRKHIEQYHNMTLTKYYDTIHNTHSKCFICEKEATFSKVKNKPTNYCKEHKNLISSPKNIYFYLSRGYSQQYAEQQISLLQKNSNKSANKLYSVDRLIKQDGYTKQQAEKIVKTRLSHNPRRRQYYNSKQEFLEAERKRFQKRKQTCNKHEKGYFSWLSKNYYSYEGLSNQEKRKIINQKLKNFRSESLQFNTRIEYYLAKGMTQQEAKQALKNRQTTFSLKKCIQKYGQEEGFKRFNQRQQKWLEKIHTPENEIKIREGQIKGRLNSQKGYSYQATQLFENICKNIDLSNYKVYYKNENNKKQYYVYTNQGVKFLDFYIKELNFAIEFDGQYWHRNKTEYDQLHRDNLIKEQINNIEILHIKEKNYNKDRIGTLNEIITIIKNKGERNETI